MTIRRITAIIVALLVGFSTLASAQEKPHNYEVGAGVNVYGILGTVGGPGRSLGPGVHFEYRYDLSDRLDVGARAYYKYGDGHSADTGEPSWYIVWNQIGLKAVADYNFRPGKLLCFRAKFLLGFKILPEITVTKFHIDLGHIIELLHIELICLIEIPIILSWHRSDISPPVLNLAEFRECTVHILLFFQKRLEVSYDRLLKRKVEFTFLLKLSVILSALLLI